MKEATHKCRMTQMLKEERCFPFTTRLHAFAKRGCHKYTLGYFFFYLLMYALDFLKKHKVVQLKKTKEAVR